MIMLMHEWPGDGSMIFQISLIGTCKENIPVVIINVQELRSVRNGHNCLEHHDRFEGMFLINAQVLVCTPWLNI